MKRLRRGASIVEALVALSVLATAVTGATQLLVLSTQQRQNADRLLVGQLEAANVLERVAAMRYEEVTPESLRGLKLSAEAQGALPAAQLKVELVEAAAPEPPEKRITAKISWSAVGDERAAVQLTAWKYPAAEAKP
jgi:Tfp pilus assembly protein PilV